MHNDAHPRRNRVGKGQSGHRGGEGGAAAAAGEGRRGGRKHRLHAHTQNYHEHAHVQKNEGKKRRERERESWCLTKHGEGEGRRRESDEAASYRSLVAERWSDVNEERRRAEKKEESRGRGVESTCVSPLLCQPRSIARRSNQEKRGREDEANTMPQL